MARLAPSTCHPTCSHLVPTHGSPHQRKKRGKKAPPNSTLHFTGMGWQDQILPTPMSHLVPSICHPSYPHLVPTHSNPHLRKRKYLLQQNTLSRDGMARLAFTIPHVPTCVNHKSTTPKRNRKGKCQNKQTMILSLLPFNKKIRVIYNEDNNDKNKKLVS